MSYKYLEYFFLEAMQNGYVADAKGFAIPRMNHTGISYESKDGKLYLVDSYCLNKETHHSAGTTTIFEDGAPVWWMSYVGYYLPGTTMYLKAALQFAYSRGMFFGGRGPDEFNVSGYKYTNTMRHNTFDFFSGNEDLHDIHGKQVGYHLYNGTVLGPRGN